MGLFKDMKGAISGAKELGDHHGGMPSIGGAFKDIKALADDHGEGEVLKDGTPARAIVKSFATPSATEKFAMQIDLEIHPQAGDPYLITYVYPTARQKAAMSVGMEIPVKYLPDDPARVAVQWDALKGSIAATGGDMATQAAQAQLYQKLSTSGVDAPGAIDAIRAIGGPDFSGATPHEFDVTITPAGGTPYQTTIRQGMLPAQMEGISQGMVFTAKYDPDQPASASLYSW